MTIRVLIADDQSMVRAGFRMLLSGEPDIEVAAEARDGLEAVAKAARFKPTVILMDIRMLAYQARLFEKRADAQ